MGARGLSQAQVAEMLTTSKATVSRSLSTASFSPAFRSEVTALVAPSRAADDPLALLHKSLHLFAQSGILLDAARSLMTQALDLAERRQ